VIAAQASQIEQTVFGLNRVKRQQTEKVSAVQKIYRLNTAEKLITALKGTREERSILIRDPNRLVATAVLGSPRITEAEMKGKPTAPDAVWWFKKMNVNVVHLAEFHAGDGHPNDSTDLRLSELDAMFKLCRKYSDRNLLFIPGEEANAHLNPNTPKGVHPGHWLYMFPRPVYLALKSEPEQPLVQQHPKYGTVYHPHNEAEMVDVLTRENLMKQATGLRGYATPLTLPGVTLDTGPDDYLPYKTMRLQQFNGTSYTLLGGVIKG